MTAAVQDAALAQGKRAVVAIKGGTYRRYVCSCASCNWFVCASRTRSTKHEPLWRVTASCLEHTNCTGIARPTQRQVASDSAFRASVVADGAATASTLTEQMRLQGGVICSSSLVRRAKEDVLKEIYHEDTRSISLLPSYLRSLSALNERVSTELCKDTRGCFERAIVALSAELFSSHQPVFGVDAAHMKHRHYNGVQIVLVARDGNMANKIAAVALAPTENSSVYEWFFGFLLASGYQLSTIPVFCDRHLGILAAAAKLNIRVHFCTRHIVGMSLCGMDRVAFRCYRA